jgi:hypothetical protein
MRAQPTHADEQPAEWTRDQIRTRDGVAIPVRATARRPSWADLPVGVRELVEHRLGAAVVSAHSAGTGFTPGFASRLMLDNGDSAFVKGASSADDRLHGWALSDAYREEVRKLALLPAGIGAPALRWHEDRDVDGERWLVSAFACVDGRPPRRPWRRDELDLVLDALAAMAPRLTPVPDALELETIEAHLAGDADLLLAKVAQSQPDPEWLSVVSALCADARSGAISGDTVVHMDLREDNVLIDGDAKVWIVDWNWPVAGAAWVDLVCLVISAVGDGFDGDELLAAHPLSRDVDPRRIDALLGLLWTFWEASVPKPVPHGSPHLRDHQRWYADVTATWLQQRLSKRPVR